jgi:hypothetical protein
MKFLEREGDGAEAKYFNTPAGALYLDRNSPRYIGGILEMLNARLFKFWNDLPEALQTGKPQNETKHGDKGIFEELYSDPEKLEQFLGEDRSFPHQLRSACRKVRFFSLLYSLRHRRRYRLTQYRSGEKISEVQMY